MDKNIAAFLRTDTKTIKVKFINDRYKGEKDMTLFGQDFELSPGSYTYITDLDIVPDELVVVYAVGIPKVALVVAVDEEVDIQPNDNKEYGWVISKLDFAHYLDNISKNKQITDTCRNAYKQNARRQYRTVVLAELTEESRTKLLSVIGE